MRNFFTDWLSRKHHYGRYRTVKGMVKDKGRNLLDIGCGRPSASMDDGSFLRYLGYGQGVDIKDMKVEFKFRKASILDLPFRNKSFDAVTAIEVLEHVDDPDLALRNVKRVLKKNATFVMTTPNNNLLFTVVWSCWQRFIGKEWRHAHVKILKKDEWLSLLEKHFRIVKVVDYWHVNLIIKMVNKKLTQDSKKRSFINPPLFLNAMIFEENKSIEKLGQRAGYLFSYFVFTTLLFFIFTRLNRLPSGWSFFHVMALTLVVALVIDRQLIDSSKAKKALGRSAAYSIDKELGETTKWHEE